MHSSSSSSSIMRSSIANTTSNSLQLILTIALWRISHPLNMMLCTEGMMVSKKTPKIIRVTFRAFGNINKNCTLCIIISRKTT